MLSLLDFSGFNFQVSSHESEHLVSFGIDVANVFVPTNVALDSQA